MSRSLKLFIAAAVVVIIVVAVYMAPDMYASAVPDYLNKNIGSFLVVDQSSLTRSPPELVLKGVHLKNPGAFGEGDAVTIGQIDITFKDYDRNPFHIETIKLQDIHGKQIIRNDTDNLTAVHSLLMDRKYQTPRGELAKPVILGSFMTHNASVSSEDGKTSTALNDKNLTPVGDMANNPPLQNVIVDVLGTVVEQQQAGTDNIALKSMGDKATQTIKEIGTSVKNFLQGP